MKSMTTDGGMMQIIYTMQMFCFIVLVIDKGVQLWNIECKPKIYLIYKYILLTYSYIKVMCSLFRTILFN
jgi:hypothetical protein